MRMGLTGQGIEIAVWDGHAETARQDSIPSLAQSSI